MAIDCKICNKIMAKQITNTHLKQHGITTAEYKKLYGSDSLTSQEYRDTLSLGRRGENNSNYGNKWTDELRQKVSQKTSGRVPWNKDKKIGSNPSHIEGIRRRENRYKTGELVRAKSTHTEETKKILSERQKEYIDSNPDQITLRAKRAVETKISKGYDFGKNMRGKSHTQESKKKISEKSKLSNKASKSRGEAERLGRINSANLSILETSEDNLHLTLSCNKCNNVFNLTRQCFTESKFKYTWCDVCFPRHANYRSKAEIELYDFIKGLSNDAVNSSRQIIKNKEVDVYVPTKKIAVEYNGLYWHSEEVLSNMGKSKISDYLKMCDTKEKQIRYIGIFEDEWIRNREIVESRLKNILGVTTNRIYARKCNIINVSSTEAAKFCRENHIQGAGRSNIRYGLVYNGKLVSVMTFTKSNISRKNSGTWEINRFCNILDHTVVGGASKLFKHFLKNINPDDVISYSDNRWSNGELYKSLGFDFHSMTPPNYWYFFPNDIHRIHRYTLRKKKSDPADLTEKEIRSEQGYLRVWDCGNTKWIWKKGS